jgi:hypothetical protein
MTSTKISETLGFTLENNSEIDEPISDCSIRCKDGSIKSHRIFLSKFSPKIKSFFVKNPKKDVFDANFASVNEVKFLLSLLQKKTLPASSKEIVPFIKLSEALGIDFLKQLSLTF